MEITKNNLEAQVLSNRFNTALLEVAHEFYHGQCQGRYSAKEKAMISVAALMPVFVGVFGASIEAVSGSKWSEELNQEMKDMLMNYLTNKLEPGGTGESPADGTIGGGV